MLLNLVIGLLKYDSAKTTTDFFGRHWHGPHKDILSSAETVNFWLRTSSQCRIPAGISLCGPCQCLRFKKIGRCLCRAISQQPYDQIQ